ncbi:hypothetical protein RRF57_007656 [Xylaria bambusicola]|uniref:Uncharacterized protein n=1 Tax=Xylaria bambusicola TaxID=326684 RepID=A0AAN7ZAX1_9PEZI
MQLDESCVESLVYVIVGGRRDAVHFIPVIANLRGRGFVEGACESKARDGEEGEAVDEFHIRCSDYHE